MSAVATLEEPKPELPPITEADIAAFVAELDAMPASDEPTLPRWPFGVQCQGACRCHCDQPHCSCQEAPK